ncbi:hypothetical protein GKF99_08380 [Finegoldia sp. BIOML-A2]|nr:hypothetical protein [Finegoldia sp. BIOML-A5]MSB01411.1 hypothetical protein [Finegoldia sp. BIOML-A2]
MKGVSMNTVRKNITLPENQNAVIERFVRNKGISFSEFLRIAAIEKIEREEKKELLEFLQENCEYVAEDEQKYFDNLGIDFSDTSDMRELDIDDVIQG